MGSAKHPAESKLTKKKLKPPKEMTNRLSRHNQRANKRETYRLLPNRGNFYTRGESKVKK